ncbi:hypothetical protein D3C71_1408290 [compost metagenome]
MVEQTPGHGEGRPRQIRHALRQFQCPSPVAVDRQHFEGDAEFQRFNRRNFSCRIDQFLGFLHADHTGQGPGCAQIGDRTDAREHHAKPRTIRSDNEVCHQRQTEPGAIGHAIHGRDQRTLKPCKCGGQLIEFAHARAHLAGVAVIARHDVDITTGTEVVAGACQHYGADVGVAADVGKGIEHGCAHVRIEGVLAGGTGHDQCGHAVGSGYIEH